MDREERAAALAMLAIEAAIRASAAGAVTVTKTLVNPTGTDVTVMLSDGSVHVMRAMRLLVVDSVGEIVEVVPNSPAGVESVGTTADERA